MQEDFLITGELTDKGFVNFTLLFWGLFAVYAVGWLLCVLSFFRNLDRIRLWGERFLILGLSLQIFIIIATYVNLEGFLFDSLSGLLLFLSLLMILIYYILNYYFTNQIFAIVFPPITLFFLALSILVSDQAIIAKAFLDKSPVLGDISSIFTHPARCWVICYLVWLV